MDSLLLNSTDPWETTGLTQATARNSIMSQGSAMITDPRYFPEVILYPLWRANAIDYTIDRAGRASGTR
jgi:hypothetical protein